MSRYTATVEWQRRDGEAFTDQRYQRAHRWRFDGGLDIAGSSSPQVVPRYSDAAAVDPEEAFVASLASCHLLWFLSLAADAGFVVEQYLDAADGTMAKNADGQLAMTSVTLRPQVRFAAGRAPDAAAYIQLHHAAHERCFIANSVKTKLHCEPTLLVS